MARRQQRTRNENAAADKGFDFGIEATFLNVPAFEWANDITRSGVAGCAYGEQFVPELGTKIPSISLIVRDGVLFKKAFSQFEEWIAGSDDDAVDVTIVFLRSGGYLLGISREIERQHALSPTPAFFDRIEMVQSWIKTMDSTHPAIRTLQQYHRGFIAPIAIDAVLLPPTGLPRPGQLMRPVPGTRPLVKFHYSFVEEDDEAMQPAAEAILSVHRGRDAPPSRTMGARRRPARQPSQWLAKRADVFAQMFPVTLFRARRTGLLDRVRRHHQSQGVVTWQVEQAICNLVTSRQVGSSGLHYNGLRRDELLDRVGRLAANYMEIADGSDSLSEITDEAVSHQLFLDASFLVKHLGETPRDNSLSSRQSILRRRGYLAKA